MDNSSMLPILHNVENGMSDSSIPVTVITGFLGSGKTTILNALLRDDRLSKTAVIVNEFGEIGLDHLLVESSLDQMMLLDNGCLCCTVRGDLVDTLDDLLRRAGAGEIPAFERIMIETTGLADPAPIVQTLATSETVAGRFHLDGIVTAVDGINGVDTIESFGEARAQAAVADLLLITKADRDDADIAGIQRLLEELNPSALQIAVRNGRVDPAAIVDLDGAFHDRFRNAGVPAPDHGHAHNHAHHSGDACDAHVHEAGAHHTWDIQSVSMVLDADADSKTIVEWLQWLVSLRGPDLLRIKGIVKPADRARPMVIHGVQHIFFPPRELADWPSSDHRSRLVLIAREIPPAALEASFARFRRECARLEAPVPAA